MNSSKEEIACVISDVFSRKFNENFTKEDCMRTAENIFDAIVILSTPD